MLLFADVGHRDLDGAVEALRAAVVADPSSAEARNALGLILVQTGKGEEADTLFREVLAARPDYHAARMNQYISAGAAIENLLLAAHASGLGSCNITFPHWVRDELMAAFQVPAEREIVSLIIVGHPGEQPVAPAHRTDLAVVLE
jgi:nitroreductase